MSEKSLLSDRWGRISIAFQAAADHPPSECRQLLEHELGDDQLVIFVEELLQLDRSRHRAPGESSLEGKIAESRSDNGVAGVEIDSYELLDEIGRGGMGVVYRARRSLGVVDQEVALKVTRAPLRRAIVAKRFFDEERALAELGHPNIAHLLDCGTTSDGWPFLAMELIHGEPLHHYSQRRRLSLHERIELFLSICAAVQHAHERLVLHCDLKPSNVVVTAEGTPKLLDFGLARLCDAETPDTSSQRDSTPGFTRAYASPEQLQNQPARKARLVPGACSKF